jgi:hypothetical protein
MRALLLSLVLLSACSGYDDLALLEVDRIEPPDIEPGMTLRIYGSGFPLGRDPDIRLRGDVHRPGSPPTSFDASLTGYVRSESLIEVPVTAELISGLGGRATVDGELRVGFAAADGHRDVFSAESTRLDFLPETEMQLRADGARDDAPEPSAEEAFGLRLSREELGTPGVRVLAVTPGGLAARQGMKAGDAVVALDGVNVYGWRDFVPDPSKPESSVLVSRDGLRGVHALRWPRQTVARTDDALALAVFALLGLVLGWCSPAALGLRAQQERPSLSIWLVRTIAVTGFSSLMLFASNLQWVTIWMIVLGTFAAFCALAAKQRTATVSFALAIGAALTVIVLNASAAIPQIVAAQGRDVMHWYLFQSPASFLAFGASLYATSAITDNPRLSASLYAAPVAVLGAVLFLGGWPLGAPLLGAAIVTGKALLFLVAARAIQARLDFGAVMCAVGFGLALVGLAVDLKALFPQWSALAAGFACALGARVFAPPLRRASTPIPA